MKVIAEMPNELKVPETITLKTTDLIELLMIIDSSCQPDFPVNKMPALLQRIKEICLKYGINWVGRTVKDI